MRIDELHETLKQKFTVKRGYGIIKLKDKGFENIHFVVPKPPPHEMSIKELPLKAVSEAMKVLSTLPSYEQMSELDKLVNYLFVRREVVQSSRLEGTWSTIDHALTPGEIADSNQGKDEHQAVRSYANLLDSIIEKTNQKKESIFTEKLINKIHKSIVENDPNSTGKPGKIREEGKPGSIVTIGGIRVENSVYNPCPASEVKRTLSDLLKWLRDKELAELGDAGIGLNLPIRLAIIHAHFEAIHPYTDGNGRVGRSLWPLQMVCSGNMPLYLSGYVEIYKSDYIKALEQAQKKLNYSPLIKFICNAIIDSQIEAKITKQAILNLEEKWIKESKFRANSTARKSLRLLLTNPIISSSFIEKSLGVSGTAANDAINALEKKKIIRFRRHESRHKIFAAEELIQILSRPFGSDIDLALEKAADLLNS